MAASLDDEILARIDADYDEAERADVVAELEAITLDHVMARSQHNLSNTWRSILEIAEGELEMVRRYAAAAKVDFRDVIMWASEKAGRAKAGG